MRFAPTDEQNELVATVRAAVAKRATGVDLRTAIATKPGYDQELWRTLVEQIGVTALAIEEEHGGIGGSYVEAHLVLEELGSTLTPSPFVGTLLATQALRAADDPDTAATASLLERIAAGTPAALASFDARPAGHTGHTGRTGLTGTAELVIDAEDAEILLAVTGDTIYEIAPDTYTTTPTESLDPTLRFATITVRDAAATPIGSIDPTYVEAVGATLMTALQAGAARRAHELTVAYLKERHQFGRPLGSYQALKHRVADLLVQVETARTMSWAAAWELTQPAPDVRLIHAAKSWCSNAFGQVAAEMIQLHGGIGITWEHDAHLYFKRAHATTQLFGRPAEHRRTIMEDTRAR